MNSEKIDCVRQYHVRHASGRTPGSPVAACSVVVPEGIIEYVEEDDRVRVFNGLQDIRRGLAREIRVYRLVMGHPRCPRRAKILLGWALAYLAMPFDLIPDFIPVIGHLDDAVIVPGLVCLALRSIPTEVIEECRSRATAAREIAES